MRQPDLTPRPRIDRHRPRRRWRPLVGPDEVIGAKAGDPLDEALDLALLAFELVDQALATRVVTNCRVHRAPSGRTENNCAHFATARQCFRLRAVRLGRLALLVS